jgi:hypothetical protein
VTYRVDYVGDGGHEGFAPIGGVPAAAPKHLGPVHIGLARNAS